MVELALMAVCFIFGGNLLISAMRSASRTGNEKPVWCTQYPPSRHSRFC